MLRPEVLRNDKDFDILYKKGKSIGGKYIVLFYRKNNLSYNRRAFLASKKVGNSVIRNRARRLIKESYRDFEEKLAPGFDILFIARNTINGTKCQNVKKSMYGVLKRAGLLTGGK